jgi:hypothetical protein
MRSCELGKLGPATAAQAQNGDALNIGAAHFHT